MIKTPQEIARIENWALFLLNGFISAMKRQIYINSRIEPNALPVTKLFTVVRDCEDTVIEIKENQQRRKQVKKKGKTL